MTKVSLFLHVNLRSTRVTLCGLLCLLSLLLASCVPAGPPAVRKSLALWGRTVTHPDVLYIGDSLCTFIYDSYEGTHFVDIAGIADDCHGGRKASGYPYNPGSQYSIIFIALGTNDVGSTSLQNFRAIYQSFINITPSTTTLYCVLPQSGTVRGISSDAYIDIIKSLCTNTIDPEEHGVGPASSDHLHWNINDHAAFGEFLKTLI